MKKSLIIVFVIVISSSMTGAVASQILASLEMTGRVTIATQDLTLYAADAFNPFLSPIGEEVTSIPLGKVEAGTTIPIGAFYLVNTGNTSVSISYDTIETLNDLPFYVEILMLDVHVDPEGRVDFMTERALQWSYDKLPYDKHWGEYSLSTISLGTGYNNAVLIDITLCADQITVTEETPFALCLTFSSYRGT
jgi:hypothetical protein